MKHDMATGKKNPGATTFVVTSGTCKSNGYRDFTDSECQTQFPEEHFFYTPGHKSDPPGCWPVLGNSLRTKVEEGSVGKEIQCNHDCYKGFACYNPPTAKAVGQCSADVPCFCKKKNCEK